MEDPLIKRFLDLITPEITHIHEIYLFGSRSRNDFSPDSDYDILIVVHKKDHAMISKLYDAVMDILLETGKLVSLKIYPLAEFNRLKSIPTPFMSNILKEGKKIGINH